MKKIISISAAILCFFASFSCTKEQFAETSAEGTQLIVSANQELSKLYLTAPKTLKWTSQDRLMGLNTDGKRFVSEQKGGKTDANGTFTFNGWEGTPAYFMYNHKTRGNEYDGATIVDGNVIAYIPCEQEVVDNVQTKIARNAMVTISAAVNSGTVEEPVYQASLCNVTGFLRITLKNVDNIKSISVGTVEDVDIAGKVSISAASISAGTPVATVIEGEKTVTLTPASGAAHQVGEINCFKISDSEYSQSDILIGVLPGTYTPVLTFTDDQGRTCTRKLARQITVARGEYEDLKTVDGTLSFEQTSFPETLTFTLGANDWNFKETAPVKDNYDNQKAGKEPSYLGEVYNYNYVDSNTGFSASCPFIFCKHYSTEDTDHGYYYDATKGFVFIKSGACITLPAIPNYSLTRVEMTCNKGSKLDVDFGYPATGETLYQFVGGETSTYDLVNPVAGKSYYLYFYTSSSITISKLKLVYTKAAEIAPVITLGYDYEIDGNPYANVFTGIPTVSTNASDSYFRQSDSNIFTPNTGSKWYWNGNNYGLFCVTAGDYLKLPKIAGYRLSKIKFGTRQDSNKTVKIVSKVGSNDFVVVGSATINANKKEIVITDGYDTAKDYYYQTGSGSVGLCSFLLTYRPL